MKKTGQIKKQGNEQNLFSKISVLIDQSKKKVATHTNSTLTILFWNIGFRINEFVLQYRRTEYGKQILLTLTTQLVSQYGRSFELRNLRRMRRFSEQFTDFRIVSTASTQLSWSHFIELIGIKTKTIT